MGREEPKEVRTVAEKKIQPKDPSKKTTKKTEASKDTKESRSKAARALIRRWRRSTSATCSPTVSTGLSELIGS